MKTITLQLDLRSNYWMCNSIPSVCLCARYLSPILGIYKIGIGHINLHVHNTKVENAAEIQIGFTGHAKFYTWKHATVEPILEAPVFGFPERTVQKLLDSLEVKAPTTVWLTYEVAKRQPDKHYSTLTVDKTKLMFYCKRADGTVKYRLEDCSFWTTDVDNFIPSDAIRCRKSQATQQGKVPVKRD